MNKRPTVVRADVRALVNIKGPRSIYGSDGTDDLNQRRPTPPVKRWSKSSGGDESLKRWAEGLTPPRHAGETKSSFEKKGQVWKTAADVDREVYLPVHYGVESFSKVIKDAPERKSALALLALGLAEIAAVGAAVDGADDDYGPTPKRVWKGPRHE